MKEGKRKEMEQKGWEIEVYHRGLKQCCEVEKSQERKAFFILRHLLLHLLLALRFFFAAVGLSVADGGEQV